VSARSARRSDDSPGQADDRAGQADNRGGILACCVAGRGRVAIPGDQASRVARGVSSGFAGRRRKSGRGIRADADRLPQAIRRIADG
jgi:hypothetical protein